MARSDLGGRGGKERLFVNWLWVGAAAIVTSGFVLRVVASLFGLPDLRLIGIVIIAIGIIVGGLGWVGERFTAHRES
jgi:hypothetical protein